MVAGPAGRWLIHYPPPSLLTDEPETGTNQWKGGNGQFGPMKKMDQRMGEGLAPGIGGWVHISRPAQAPGTVLCSPADMLPPEHRSVT